MLLLIRYFDAISGFIYIYSVYKSVSVIISLASCHPTSQSSSLTSRLQISGRRRSAFVDGVGLQVASWRIFPCKNTESETTKYIVYICLLFFCFMELLNFLDFVRFTTEGEIFQGHWHTLSLPGSERTNPAFPSQTARAQQRTVTSIAHGHLIG